MSALILFIILFAIVFFFYMSVKFLNTYGVMTPSSLLILFLNEIKKIEDGSDGKIVVKKIGNFDVIMIYKDNKITDSISVDINDSKIYSGIVADNNPHWSDILIPVRLPYNYKNVDEVRIIEDKLVDEIIQVIVKYGE